MLYLKALVPKVNRGRARAHCIPMHASLALLLSAAAATCCSATVVVPLGIGDFESETQAATGATTGDWLVYFYAPWCPHCMKLGPKIETFAKAMKKKVADGTADDLIGVNVASVDVPGANALLGQRFQITGYPTLLFLSKGTVREVKQRPPTVKAFAKYVAAVRDGSAAGEAIAVAPPVGGFAVFVHTLNSALERRVPDWFVDEAVKRTPPWVIENAVTILPVLVLLAILSLVVTCKFYCWITNPSNIAWLRGEGGAGVVVDARGGEGGGGGADDAPSASVSAAAAAALEQLKKDS